MTTPITQEELKHLKELLVVSPRVWDKPIAKMAALIAEWEPLMRGMACSNGPYDRPCCQARQSLGRFDAKTK